MRGRHCALGREYGIAVSLRYLQDGEGDISSMTVLADVTPDLFYGGLAITEYIDGMSKNRRTFEENYSNFELTAEEIGALRGLPYTTHVLVLTEDWCGDSLRYLPALIRMAEAGERWDIRVFYRDAHPELADRWLKHGTHRAIPIFVFFEEDWNEYACFIEKPEPVYGEELQARAAFAAAHPDLPDSALPAGEMSQPTLDLFAPYMRSFRSASTPRWQHMFVAEVVGK